MTLFASSIALAAALGTQVLPGDPERLPGDPPRTPEATYQGTAPGAVRVGFAPYVVAAAGLAAVRSSSSLTFGVSLAALAGVSYHFNSNFGLLAQLGGQTALGVYGATGVSAGLGISHGTPAARWRLSVGPAFLLNLSTGLSVSVDILRSLRGPLTIGASLGYLRYSLSPDVGQPILQQEIRICISGGYGE